MCIRDRGMTTQGALDRIENEMIPYYPLGVFKDKTAEGTGDKNE